jgi:hypothetical protein
MNATVFLRLENAIGWGICTGLPAPASPLKSTSAATNLSPLFGKFNLLKQHYFFLNFSFPGKAWEFVSINHYSLVISPQFLELA